MTDITSTGFVRTRLDERFQQLVTAMEAIFGPEINTDPDSIDGQHLGIFAEASSNLDQLAEEVYNSQNPATAVGDALSRLVLLNFIDRIAGAFSTVTLTLGGTVGTLIPAGSLVRSSLTGVTFALDANATITGTGTVTTPATATELGLKSAPAGTVTLIDTPVFGWQTVTNPNDAILGRERETDEALRVRRRNSTATAGSSLRDSLYGSLANLEGVKQVAVYENEEDVVQPVTALPPHSIYCVVDGGVNAEIAEVIFSEKTMGVTQVGAVSEIIVDSQGNNQTIKFSRPDEDEVYVYISLVKQAGFPVDGEDQIKTAIVEWAAVNQGIGDDVIWSQLFIPINSVPGHSVTDLFIGFSPGPVNDDNLVIDFDHIARFDSTRIVIAST